jgi:hypothetical protein
MSKSRIVVLKPLKPLSGFQPGHLRVGGRQKRTAAEARSLADTLGVDPLAYLLNLLAVDATMELEFAEDGTERKIKVPVSRELKIDISKSLAGFFYPKLNSQQVTGPNEGPIEITRASNELERAMAAPGGVEIIQRAALLLAGQPDAPPARICPGPDETEERREMEERRGV